MKQLFIYVPDDIHKALKYESESKDIGISTYVRKILSEKFNTKNVLIRRHMQRGGHKKHKYGDYDGNLPIKNLN